MGDKSFSVSRLQWKKGDNLIPKNTLEKTHSSSSQTALGKPYELKPFKMFMNKDKKYSWCACGHSKSQPLCDGTHKLVEIHVTMKPVVFSVEESKDYWLCNCKATAHRPFCDGTHKKLKELADEKAKKKE